MLDNLASDPSPSFGPVNDFQWWDFDSEEEEEEGEEEVNIGLELMFRSERQRVDSREDGLRIVGIDSDSDSDSDSEDGIVDLQSGGERNGVNDPGRVDEDLPAIWDSFFGEESIAAHDELEWEEVHNIMNGADNALTIFDRLEAELSASSSGISSENDHEPLDNQENDLDWQVLLAVNNVVNYEGVGFNMGMSADADNDFFHYLADNYEENYGDYDAVFGQLLDDDGTVRGSLPAAKTVVESLPVVELTSEELKKGDVICAVCKEEIMAKEKVRRLPCSHYYHGECIVPWLAIRNTCPVCRHELPIDDTEDETTSQLFGHSLARDSVVSFDFELA